MRLVRLLAVALATGCFVVTGELWSSALNPSPTIVFPTPVQPPPRLLPGDLSRHGPPAILRLKPVPTHPIPHAKSPHGHGKGVARHGGKTHRAARTAVVARQRGSTPPVAPAAASAAPASTSPPKPPAKPAPGPKPIPQPPKSPGTPTPPTPTPPAPTPTPTPTPAPPAPTPPSPQTPPSVEAPPPIQPPTPVSTPPTTPTPAPPTTTPTPPSPPPPSTPEPPAPTPPPDSDTRPGHGYGDKNHQHTGPPGQAGP